MLKILDPDPGAPPSQRRHVTIMLGFNFDGWEMPPFQQQQRPWLNGGVRALIELAAGIASTGAAVDLRGEFLESEVARMEAATGVRIGRPSDRRRPTADDIVIVPEAFPSPILFARVALSPARAIMYAMGALGLFGWSFDDHPTPTDAQLSDFDIGSVGRPEQYVAVRRFGLELWSNVAAIAEQGTQAGVPVHYIGAGRPIPYPEPGEKDIDVLILGENRWAPLAKQVLATLPGDVVTLVAPRVDHTEMLALLGRARILIHPSRMEGRSRLVEEARAMRTVPVVLDTNTLGEGYGEVYGSVPVGTLEEMTPAILALLADRPRLDALAGNGHRTARELGDWELYKQRLTAALDAPDEQVASWRSARAQLGGQLNDWIHGVAQQISVAQQQLSQAAERIKAERQALELERGRLR